LKHKKLIAWHKQHCLVPKAEDIMLASQIYRTLTETIQGPCLENQVMLMKARACRGVQGLLTYIGAFNYKKTNRK
jgi:hypothetical protein